jgi:hypothetical protein
LLSAEVRLAPGTGGRAPKEAALPTPELLHTLATAGGPLGVATVVATGLIRLAKAITPHVTALLAQRQRLRTSRDLADAHPHHRIEITPDWILIAPADGLAPASSRRADVASLLPNATRRNAIASKRRPS